MFKSPIIWVAAAVVAAGLVMWKTAKSGDANNAGSDLDGPLTDPFKPGYVPTQAECDWAYSSIPTYLKNMYDTALGDANDTGTTGTLESLVSVIEAAAIDPQLKKVFADCVRKGIQVVQKGGKASLYEKDDDEVDVDACDLALDALPAWLANAIDAAINTGSSAQVMDAKRLVSQEMAANSIDPKIGAKVVSCLTAQAQAFMADEEAAGDYVEPASDAPFDTTVYPNEPPPPNVTSPFANQFGNLFGQNAGLITQTLTAVTSWPGVNSLPSSPVKTEALALVNRVNYGYYKDGLGIACSGGCPSSLLFSAAADRVLAYNYGLEQNLTAKINAAISELDGVASRLAADGR